MLTRASSPNGRHPPAPILLHYRPSVELLGAPQVQAGPQDSLYFRQKEHLWQKAQEPKKHVIHTVSTMFPVTQRPKVTPFPPLCMWVPCFQLTRLCVYPQVGQSTPGGGPPLPCGPPSGCGPLQASRRATWTWRALCLCCLWQREGLTAKYDFR